MSKKFTRGAIAKRAMYFILISAFIITSSILINESASKGYVYNNSDWDDFSYIPEYDTQEWNVLFDAHSHTLYSDGLLTPEQNLLWHMSLGFNACVITDHLNGGYPDPWSGAEKAREIARDKYDDQIKVLPGIEYTTRRFHMNIILPPDATGYREEIPWYGSEPTNDEISELIGIVHGMGGIVIVDHFPWSLPRMPEHPTLEEFLSWGIDYIEVINGNDFDFKSYEFCLENDLGVITGTDMHTPQWNKHNGWNPVGGWTLLNVSEFSEQAIFDELKAKRTKIHYVNIELMPEYAISHDMSPTFTALRPFIQIGGIFRGYWLSSNQLDWGGVSIWFGWLVWVFVVSELIRYYSPKFQIRRKEKKSLE